MFAEPPSRKETTNSLLEICAVTSPAWVFFFFLFGIKGEKLCPSRDADLPLSAPLRCNSFRAEFCLTQHIIPQMDF